MAKRRKRHELKRSKLKKRGTEGGLTQMNDDTFIGSQLGVGIVLNSPLYIEKE